MFLHKEVFFLSFFLRMNTLKFSSRYLNQRILEMNTIIKQSETPWNTAWEQQNKDWPPFQSSEEMQQQVRLLSLRDAAQKRSFSNTQTDSFRAKLFRWHFVHFFPVLPAFLTFRIIHIGPRKYVMYRSYFICLSTPYTFSLFNLIMA